MNVAASITMPLVGFDFLKICMSLLTDSISLIADDACLVDEMYTL